MFVLWQESAKTLNMGNTTLSLKDVSTLNTVNAMAYHVNKIITI